MTQVNKPRLVVPGQPFKKFVGEKRADSDVCRTLRFGGQAFFGINRHVVTLCTNPVGPRFAPPSEVEFTSKSGEHTFVGQQTWIVGLNCSGIDRLIGVAKEHRVVAVPPCR